jgi:hypothetical protein
MFVSLPESGWQKPVAFGFAFTRSTFVTVSGTCAST